MSTGRTRRKTRRGLAVVRVSVDGGRTKTGSLLSPAAQMDRVREACEDGAIELLSIPLQDEVGISGRKTLAERPALRMAVEMVEEDEADIIVFAHYDRAWRSLEVEQEVVSRVEAVGGRIYALGHGWISHRNASDWKRSKMAAVEGEAYSRESTERSMSAQKIAVLEGRAPKRTPYGYRRGADRTLEIYEPEAALVREAFARRLAGEPVTDIAEWLRGRGVQRNGPISYKGTQGLLAQDLYTGDIVWSHHGEPIVNRDAHPAIVERDVFDRVQRMRRKANPGRRARTPHLLTGLGVLRCGSCLKPMVIGPARVTKGEAPRYWAYKCSSVNPCPAHVTISERIADAKVWEAAKEAARGIQARGSAAEDAQAARHRADEAWALVEELEATEANGRAAIKLAHAIMVAEGDAEELELEAQRLASVRVSTVVDVDDVELLADKRAIIADVILSAVVAKGGTGAERITITIGE